MRIASWWMVAALFVPSSGDTQVVQAHVERHAKPSPSPSASPRPKRKSQPAAAAKAASQNQRPTPGWTHRPTSNDQIRPDGEFSNYLANALLTGTIDQTIDTSSAVVGQQFTISRVRSDGENLVGATMYGHVCDVASGSQGRPAKLEICLDKLKTSSGGSYALDGRVVAVSANNTGMAGAGIIGGTNAGGLLGAAGRSIYAKNTKKNATIPAHSLVTVEVVRARRQVGPALNATPAPENVTAPVPSRTPRRSPRYHQQRFRHLSLRSTGLGPLNHFSLGRKQM